jgi:hypothetical protein
MFQAMAVEVVASSFERNTESMSSLKDPEVALFTMPKELQQLTLEIASIFILRAKRIVLSGREFMFKSPLVS